MSRALIVDDQRRMRRVLQIMLEQMGMESVAAESAEQGLEQIEKDHFEIVLTDLRMPGMDGIDFLRRIRETHPELPVVVMTAHGTIATAVEAMKLGASDFLTRPFELDTLEFVVKRALDLNRFRVENRFLRQEVQRTGSFAGIVGSSPGMQAVFELVEQVAQAKSSVLVTGETGTGKELVARAIHDRSPREGKLFVPINCSAIPADLMESELFGHTRGAFSGATANREGKFSVASGGTIFLDEIGDMDFRLQSKLLRVLQEGVIDPVGANRSIEVDVRVVSATNRDLGGAVKDGGFRDDLLYRLNVFHIEIPPLRERAADIPDLAGSFLAHFGEELGRPGLPIADGAFEPLQSYDWPGNVRELRNLMERAAVLCRGDVDADFIRSLLPKSAEAPVTALADEPESLDLEHAVSEAERKAILRALGQVETKAEAAELLGIGERTLWTKLKKLGL